jgi:hypothetical protein
MQKQMYSTCLNRYSWSLTIALCFSIAKISRSGAKIIKLLYERDESEGYVARDLCILMKEVNWNPDRTVMNEIVHMYYLGVQKGQQSHLQKSKIVLSHFFGKNTVVKYGQELHLSRICITISFNY